MKQSPNDHKRYKAITLSNGLRVLLIENLESDKAAAALAVNAGHFNDPKHRQGLAHFVEHMLFLGTEKYPDGSEYQRFISQHGGHNNAWTGTEHTCYFFDIHYSHLEASLDRFSRFFYSPQLSPEFVNSERQNIDAEFKLKLKDDIRRLYDVHKETINQAHPFSQFSVGNIDTLADNEHGKVHTDIVNFFNTYYSANLMTLALEAPLPLTELEQIAERYFHPIANHNKPLPPITEPLYLEKDLAKRIYVTPVKNDRQLIISFAMPSIDKYYQHKPESVLAYLIGHEGKGSLLSYLKEKHWAMALTAGAGINGSNFKDFNISIRLTESGEQKVDAIIEACFSYIKLLQVEKIAEFYYQEKTALADLAFEYQEKLKPLESVSQLVTNMQHYPPEHYIYGDYIMTGMCQQTITELLSYLTPQNCRIIHIGQNEETNAQTNWYQVPYRIDEISEQQLQHWRTIAPNVALHLPEQNPYIVASPEVYDHEVETSTPSLITEKDGLKVWYKQDTTFKVPKGYIYIGIDSPLAIASNANIAMTRLFVDLYTDSVIEKYYDAELAGIHYNLYSHQGGMTLQLSGICANQPKLLTKLLADLQHFSPDNARFSLIKTQLISHWRNADKSKSISQLFSTLSSFMQPNNPCALSLADALAEVEFEQFCRFSQQLFDQITLEALVHGNWLSHHGEHIAQLIEQTFEGKFGSQYKVDCPVINLANEPELLVPVVMPEHDHAVVVYYPHTTKDLDSTALIMLISHLLSPLFFEEMRTEKQYGYLVNVGFIPINRYPGLAFYIQSPNVEPDILVNEINNFIDHWRNKANHISRQQWQALKHGLIGQLQEKDASLRIKSQRFWNAICNQDLAFKHKEKMIAAIENAEISDLAKFISIHQSESIQANLNQTEQKASKYQNRITLVSSRSNLASFEQNNCLAGKIIKNLEIFTQNCKRKF